MKLVTVWLVLVSAALWQPLDHVCVLHAEVPDYPEMARLARLQGEVKMVLILDNMGRVAAISEIAGPIPLRDEAEENIRKWTFESSQEASRYHTIVFEFRIEGEAVTYVPRPRVSFDLPGRVLIVTKPAVPFL